MNESSVLPHQKLIVYERGLQLLDAVAASQIADAKLRDQALRSAKSVCLNIAEGAARYSAADKARLYVIARAEAAEAAAAVQIAARAGDSTAAHAQAVDAFSNEIFAMLTAMIKRLSLSA
jgi:four helix bundle protein